MNTHPVLCCPLCKRYVQYAEDVKQLEIGEHVVRHVYRVGADHCTYHVFGIRLPAQGSVAYLPYYSEKVSPTKLSVIPSVLHDVPYPYLYMDDMKILLMEKMQLQQRVAELENEVSYPPENADSEDGQTGLVSSLNDQNQQLGSQLVALQSEHAQLKTLLNHYLQKEKTQLETDEKKAEEPTVITLPTNFTVFPPNPSEFYEHVSTGTWKYSSDEKLLFFKAFFALDQVSYDGLEDLLMDDQLKELLVYLKDARKMVSEVRQAFGNLSQEKEFQQFPEHLRVFVEEHIASLETLPTDTSLLTSKDLRTLGSVYMLTAFLITGLGEVTNETIEEQKPKRKRTKKVVATQETILTKDSPSQIVKEALVPATLIPAKDDLLEGLV